MQPGQDRRGEAEAMLERPLERSIGGTIWADLSIRLTHFGPMSMIMPEPLVADAAV